MDPQAIGSVDRVVHGGSEDGRLIDCSVPTNPRRPGGVARVYGAALGTARTYPHDDYCAYRIAAGEFVGCEPADVVPTAGALAAVRLALSTTVGPGDRVLVPRPASTEYEREVGLQGAEPTFVDHDVVHRQDPDPVDAILLANPNDPTGAADDTAALADLAARCREAGVPLVVDESYLGFTERDSLAGTPGTIVCRSPSTLFGLPGLRMGFAVATGELGTAMETARRTCNLSGPAAAVGVECLRDEAFVRESRERIASERRRLRAALDGRFDVHPSEAPFVLLDVGDRAAAAVCRAARDRGVVLRDGTSFRGLENHVRVGVGRAEQNDRVCAVLADV